MSFKPTHRRPIPNSSTLPSSFTSSYRIHESLMGDLDLPTQITAQLSNWLVCFLVIQFDVDIGPDLKIIRPSIQFVEEDFRTICFSSLPERSGISSAQTTQFHTFRFNSDTHGLQELYGYSMFTQQRDMTATRGYLQESLVIISQHNFPKLFEKCLNGILQHEKFLYCTLEQKIPCLDNAIYNIAAWPNPEPSTLLEIGFMGNVYNVVVPKDDYTPLIGYNKKTPNEISAAEPVGSWNTLIQYFNDINDLYVLYEHAILGKPLIIYSTTPRLCSSLISNLVDLIRPIPYSERIREYVTIHSCPKVLTAGMTGITNPMLIQPDMDAYVFLLTRPQTTRASKWASKLLIRNSPANNDHITYELPDNDDQFRDEIEKLKKSVSLSNKAKLKSRLLTPDNKFINQLQQQISQNASTIDYTIRFHFATLTSKLIAPLNVYLIPSPVDNDSLIFNQLDFVNDLSNDDAWDEPVEPLRTFEEQQHDNINNNNKDNQTKSPTTGVWHTLQRMGSKASLFSQQSLGIKFANNNSVVSKQDFYHSMLKSSNFKAWLNSNGVYSYEP